MPVDTIRSWVVVGACFYISTVIYGVIRLSGVFFVASMPRYHVGRSAASFPYTFVNFVNFLTGPLLGYLGHKFGIHKILIIGSLFSTIGLGACFFVENIYYIYIFYGLMLGIGCGSCLLLPVLINQHFIKYRAIASGVRTSGKSFGSFIMPPIAEILLDKYGLSGTFLLLSGFAFNCLPATLLLRAMKFDTISKLYPHSLKWSDAEKEPLLKCEKSVKVYSESTLKKNNTNVLTEEKQLNSKLSTQYSKNIGIYNESGIAGNSLMNNKISKKSQNTHNPAIHTKENLDSSENESNIDIARNVLESNQSIHSTSKNLSVLKKTATFSIVLDPVFICLAIARSSYLFILTCLTTVIVDFASDIGVPKKEQSYTVMVFSVGELVGPLCFGWLIDKSFFSKTTFLAVTCYLQALVAVSIAFSNGSVMLFSLLGAIGFVHSVEAFVIPLLVADFIPEAKQTVAMTSISFLAAPLTLLVSPLIGFLRDDIGSYEYIFYGLGVLSALSGLLISIIPCLSKGRNKV